MTEDSWHADSPADPSEEEFQTPPPPTLPPLWKRVIDVFFSPGRLMEAVAANPKPWGALAVGAILVGLAGFLIPAELYEEFIRSTALERGDPVPDDLGTLGNVSRISGLIAGPLFWVLWSLLLGGVATLIFAFVMGDRGRFKQYFAAAAHSLIIPAIGGVLMVPLRIANQNPREVLSVGTFLGGLVPEGYFLNVLNAMDLFALAGFAVLAVGASRIDRARGWGSAFAALFVVNLLISMGFAVFA
jgi:hypothetical protein